MDVLQALGYQFRIQRFITIPNYQLPGESLIHLLCRLIPIMIITVIALTDTVDMLTSVGTHLEEMSNVPFVVAKFDMIVIKLGVVFVVILALYINRIHLKILKTIDVYDESIRRYQERYVKNPVGFPTRKRSNLEFFLVFIVNSILILNLHLMTSMKGPPKQILFNGFHALLLCVHDYVMLYISNLIRLFGCHEQQLVQILENDLSRNNHEVFALVDDFCGTINMINQGFGSLTFFTFSHHLVGSCMSTYLLFWLIFVSPHFEVIIPFILSSLAYNIRMITYLIHMSVVGESIPKKVSEVINKERLLTVLIFL